MKRQHNTSGYDLERTSRRQAAAYRNGQITNKRGLRAKRINRKKKKICFANIIKFFAAFSPFPPTRALVLREKGQRRSLQWQCSTNPQRCVESCNPREINWDDFGRESPKGGQPGQTDAGDAPSPSRQRQSLQQGSGWRGTLQDGLG